MFRSRRLVIATVTILVLILLVSLDYRFRLYHALSYASRPLWDKPDGPATILPHYYTEGLAIDEHACKLHGWASRTQQPKMWDAVIVSSEMDLLEIRMNELDLVVDKFFIIESNRTFSGLPKPLSFASNRHKFAAFEHKIVYELFAGGKPGDDAWTIEADHRNTMTRLIRDTYSSAQMSVPSLVISADVDEIPSRHTLQLLKRCQAPNPIHLQMRSYSYSFEWPVGRTSWRPSVQLWEEPAAYYRHSQSSDVALADSGWHCTFCFRHLDEFVQKMKGFSHYDRVGGDESLVDPANIQQRICEGKDVFGMLPEAFSYKDLLAWAQPDPSKTGIGLPLYLLQHPERYPFLLPGGCVRRDD